MAQLRLVDYPISVAPLLFFDIETTGLRPDRGAVITEMAVVDHASIRYDWKSERDSNSLADSLARLFDHLNDGVVIGHNLRFDFRFITYEADRRGMPGPRIWYADTLGLARQLLEGVTNFELGTLLSHFDRSPRSELHTALGDAWATRALFWALVEHGGLRTLADAGVKPLNWTVF